MKLFDGDVRFSALSMERRSGSRQPQRGHRLQRPRPAAPDRSAGFPAASPAASTAHVHDLRLVDWTPVAFDAEMHSVRRPGVKQRISQRAVQNISSVGGALRQQPAGPVDRPVRRLATPTSASPAGSRTRSARWAASPTTFRSGGNSFTIVAGAGCRLDVVGFNRSVDWPTLVERLEAVGKGDVKPVVR